MSFGKKMREYFMSEPIRISTTIAQEILGPEFKITDDGNGVLNPGDIVANFSKPVEDRVAEVVAQSEKDAFFDYFQPEKFLDFLKQGHRNVTLVSGEKRGRVFLVVSRQYSPNALEAIYEIGNFVDIKSEYTDAPQDKKVSLNIDEAETTRFADFDFEDELGTCASPKHPGYLKEGCVKKLKSCTDKHDRTLELALQLVAARKTIEAAYQNAELGYDAIDAYLVGLSQFQSAKTDEQECRREFALDYTKKQQAQKNVEIDPVPASQKTSH
jgi:hypothetical protein